MSTIKLEELNKPAFAAFGDVIEIDEHTRHYPINNATTERFHDLSTAIATGEDARVIFSMARAAPFSLPLQLTMMERHPYGSQAFVPVRPCSFVVVVAGDEGGKPGTPMAFLTRPGQGINYFAGTWHGALTALDESMDFLIVDREGDGENCDVHTFDRPYRIEK